LKTQKIIALLALSFLMFLPLSAYPETPADPADIEGFDDPGTPDGGDAPVDPDSEMDAEEPSFQNFSQMQHAQNISEAALAELDEAADEAAEGLNKAEEEQTETGLALREAYTIRETTEQDLAAALEARKSARKAYDEAVAAGNARAIAKAKDELDAARQGYVDAEKTNKRAENYYADKEAAYTEARRGFKAAEDEVARVLEAQTGVSLKAIHEMRYGQKMGWGLIAREVGVAPRVIALKTGHIKKGKKQVEVDPEEEFLEATKRNTKTGWSDGHGLMTSRSKSSKEGLGLTATSGIANSDVRGNKSGNKGNSSNSASSSASSSKGSSKSDRGSVGGPSNDKSSTGNSSSGKSKSDRGKTGGPSNDKDKSGNNGNDKGKGGEKGNKGGNSGKK
jgi:hypothetical protein